MVATKWLARAAIVAGLLAFAATGAQAVTLSVTSGGLEATNASNYGCPTAAGTCTLAQRDYALSADALAAGTITVNALGTIIDIQLTVASATFTGPGGPVTFGPVTYLATLSSGVVTTPIGPGVGGISSGFGTGSVSGTVNGNPFSVSPSVSISCNYPGGTGQCGISFGESGFTNVVGRDWRHQFDVTVALPEPTTGLLIVLGLAGLALRSRSH